MQTLVQNMQIVNLKGAADQNAVSMGKSSGNLYVSLKGYNKVTFKIACGAMGDSAISVSGYQAKTVTGTSVAASALAMTHYWTNKASTSKATLVRTSASSNKFTMDSTNNAIYVVEFDAKQLNAASSFDCIGLGITGNAVASTFFSVEAILHDARYAADAMPVNGQAN
jgi:hypothetical protein